MTDPTTPPARVTPIQADFIPIEHWEQQEDKDTLCLLLVDYTGEDAAHPLEDADQAITIGHNNDHNVGEDEGEGWQFAGWCWCHDHYTEGKGTVIGFIPINSLAGAALSEREQAVREAVSKAIRLRERGDTSEYNMGFDAGLRAAETVALQALASHNEKCRFCASPLAHPAPDALAEMRERVERLINAPAMIEAFGEHAVEGCDCPYCGVRSLLATEGR